MALLKAQPAAQYRRIYPLSPRDLTEEQIAVAFAMTSRRPEPFDEIAAQVSAQRAADFNRRWVVGYGHSSVAEHAVIHLAVENISRLACDGLEDNRLASYTEKSSRYQVIDAGSFHIPQELDAYPQLRGEYIAACRGLFDAYQRLLDGVMRHLRRTEPPQDGEQEQDGAARLRLRRLATDACRAALPAATLTNVGVTANARALEHAISKLLSSELAEERDIGAELREQGRQVAPTLVKYAGHNPYLAERRRISGIAGDDDAGDGDGDGDGDGKTMRATLADYDRDAVRRLAAALLFRQGGRYADVARRVDGMSGGERQAVVDDAVRRIGPHDAAPREFELAGYTFEFVFDYGALREFRRHRMQTCLSQPLTIGNGYDVPPLIEEAGMRAVYEAALAEAERAFMGIRKVSPAAAQYLVTHGHRQRALARISLRECYHLFRLRASRQAHESIRGPVLAAMRLAVAAQPELFRHLRLRDAPAWWPFAAEPDAVAPAAAN